ncbi:Glyoxalase-like domain protein [Botrimarina colliarenosi]|uniref:Glyoxalase-like domain protein n=1 Tax=Botrimarina colliarenosi TaxID=2528001 RepID=A0A5C6AJR7_9BACT|nr:VOC family protein [Botrimarina colliarenosi]TWT99656.1 Glyoxalase-like domain protein [Botrimarina colliarenosi]
MPSLTPFHVAVPVHDIDAARVFYGGVLGCPEGRSTAQWIDFDLFGHQFVVHLDPSRDPAKADAANNAVDGHGVPIPHYGVVLEMADWEALRDRLASHHVAWVIEPYTRFKGEPGEQSTMFLRDPSGTAIEFKAFRDIAGQLFAK